MEFGVRVCDSQDDRRVRVLALLLRILKVDLLVVVLLRPQSLPLQVLLKPFKAPRHVARFARRVVRQVLWMEGHDHVVELVLEVVPQCFCLVGRLRLALLHAEDNADGFLGNGALRNGAQRHGNSLHVLLVLGQEDPMNGIRLRLFGPVTPPQHAPVACHHGAVHADDGAAAKDDHPDAVGEHHHAGDQGQHREDLLWVRPREEDQYNGQAKDKEARNARAEPFPDDVEPPRHVGKLVHPQHWRSPPQTLLIAAGSLQRLVRWLH
mmetsp:Transcript_20449/g.55798  ORF Transcript_20449/g.55798 Transcript_20449/m.55798 type:complete len:265 (-) Transcript_20449:661-1455(-)